MTERLIRTGTTIQYCREGVEHSGAIISIEHCLRRGDMFGKSVRELAWDKRDFAFLTLDTGFCYGTELKA